jgi:hypothetical protein
LTEAARHARSLYQLAPADPDFREVLAAVLGALVRVQAALGDEGAAAATRAELAALEAP